MVYFSYFQDFDPGLVGNEDFYLKVNDIIIDYGYPMSEGDVKRLIKFLDEHFAEIIGNCDNDDIIDLLTDDQKRYLLQQHIEERYGIKEKDD